MNAPQIKVAFYGERVVVGRPSIWNIDGDAFAIGVLSHPKSAAEDIMVPMADPEALTKLGEAILSFDIGYIAKHKKKARKKNED